MCKKTMGPGCNCCGPSDYFYIATQQNEAAPTDAGIFGSARLGADGESVVNAPSANYTPHLRSYIQSVNSNVTAHGAEYVPATNGGWDIYFFTDFGNDRELHKFNTVTLQGSLHFDFTGRFYPHADGAGTGVTSPKIHNFRFSRGFMVARYYRDLPFGQFESDVLVCDLADLTIGTSYLTFGGNDYRINNPQTIPKTQRFRPYERISGSGHVAGIRAGVPILFDPIENTWQFFPAWTSEYTPVGNWDISPSGQVCVPKMYEHAAANDPALYEVVAFIDGAPVYLTAEHIAEHLEDGNLAELGPSVSPLYVNRLPNGDMLLDYVTHFLAPNSIFQNWKRHYILPKTSDQPVRATSFFRIDIATFQNRVIPPFVYLPTTSYR